MYKIFKEKQCYTRTQCDLFCHCSNYNPWLKIKIIYLFFYYSLALLRTNTLIWLFFHFLSQRKMHKWDLKFIWTETEIKQLQLLQRQTSHSPVLDSRSGSPSLGHSLNPSLSVSTFCQQEQVQGEDGSDSGLRHWSFSPSHSWRFHKSFKSPPVFPFSLCH